MDGLYPLKSKVKLNEKIATFDLEFNRDNLQMWTFYNGKNFDERKDYGTKLETFIGRVIRKEFSGYSIYAHYGGKADFLFLLDELLKYKYDFNIIDVNGRILEITLMLSNGRKIKFRDSYALMPKDLESLMTSFKTEHQKLPIDFSGKEKNLFSCLEHNKVDCLYCHCRNDTIGLYESIMYFKNIINSFNANIKLTIASTSLNLFRSKFLKQFIPNINYEIINGYDVNKNPTFINPEKIIRQYYVGGRSEIFKRHCFDEHYYDINSLYPDTMRNNDFPVSNPIYVLSENLNFEKDKGFAFAEIEYHNSKIIPFLPVRFQMKTSNKLIYPVGKWQGLYDLDNLRKAKKLGYKIDIKYAFIFNYDFIFKEFVDELYSYRLKSDALNIVIKFLLNSLYGKFAQKRLIKSVVRLTNGKININDVNDLVKLIPYNDEFGLYKIEQEINSNHIIPSLSYRVTQLSQKTLYQKIEECNHDITYCDTDSIITPCKLKTGKNLGELKEEYEIEEAIFLLPKTYYLKGYNFKKEKNETNIKMKGFTNQNFTYQDFFNALYNNDYLPFNYVEERLFGFKESMNRRNKFLTFEEKKKGLQSLYDKRIICDDCITTKPLMIHEGIIIKQ